MLAVAHVLGLMLAAFGAIYVLPVLAAIIAADGTSRQFALAGLISVGAGLALAAATRGRARELKPRDGFLLVTVGWTLMSASAAIPLMMLLPHLTFTDAFFETMSGLTTTGSTVLTGLDGLPPSINLWRATLHWCGGLGIIVLAVAVLPLLGVGGMQLYKAEAPGPVKDEKLTPRITETAKSLWISYIAITAVGIIALRLCGMSWFDAICHCFSAVGLGGFSTHDASIAYFNSPAIELVLSALMLVASLSFTRHFVALRRFTLKRRRWKTVGIVSGDKIEDAERRFFDAWVRQAPARDGSASMTKPSTPPVTPTPSAPEAPGVIGLFPEPGASR